MKQIIMFSTPNEENLDELLRLIFPLEIKNKVFAYMPSNGANCPKKYIDEWKEHSRQNSFKFIFIDNSKTDSDEESVKLLNASTLLITGGNTFQLLYNLRKSGLDKAIKEFITKDEYVLSGFSAGAIILTPTIEICKLPNYDENLVDLQDLTGLGVIDFEVFPHYSKEHKTVLADYVRASNYEVRPIKDEEYIIVNKE